MGDKYIISSYEKVRLLLAIMTVCAVIAGGQPVQDQKQAQAPTQNDQAVVGKDDGAVAVAFSLLVKCCLPNRTRLTSGFRTANDQLRVIRHYAQMEGIPFPPNMKVENPATWQSVVAELRRRGLKIADPDKTPHSDEELIVIDLVGPNQTEIENGCRRAATKGLVKIERVLREGPKQAVHVELSLTQRGYQELNLLLPASNTGATTGGSSRSNSLPSSSAKDALRVFIDLHDQAKGNPARQIDLDYLMLDLLEPGDFANQNRLRDEIKEHEQAMEKLALDKAKLVAIEEINAAERDDRLDDALKLAKANSEKFSDDSRFKGYTTRFEAMVQVNIAKEIFFARNCEQSDHAKEAISRARQIEPSNQVASRLEIEIQRWAARCSSTIYFWIFFGVILFIGMVLAIYFSTRIGHWEVRCIDGPRKGEAFELDKPEVTIGALGPPDGEADIIIDDRKRRISRQHCIIWQEGRNFFIIDVSTGGTSVNGQPISKENGHLLRNKDEISLAGAATLIFKRSTGTAQKAG